MVAPDVSAGDLIAHLDLLHDLLRTHSPGGPPAEMASVPAATVMAVHDACDPTRYTAAQTRDALAAAGHAAICAVIVLEYGLHCRALRERGVDTFVQVARLRLWMDPARRPARPAVAAPPRAPAPTQHRLL